MAYEPEVPGEIRAGEIRVTDAMKESHLAYLREHNRNRFGCIDPKGDPAPAGEEYLQVADVEPFTVDDILQNTRTGEIVRVKVVQDEIDAPALEVQRGVGGDSIGMEPGDELLVVASAAAQQGESA